MRRIVLACLTLLGVVSIGGADLVTPKPALSDQDVMPFGIRAYSETFKANVPARAIIEGGGASAMGLYVFDAEGNCVAWDDVSSPITADDAAVVWIPPSQQRYSIEVRNGGSLRNSFRIAIR